MELELDCPLLVLDRDGESTILKKGISSFRTEKGKHIVYILKSRL